MAHNTQDLLDIFDKELKSALRGDRLLLSSEERVGVPSSKLALHSKQLGVHLLAHRKADLEEIAPLPQSIKQSLKTIPYPKPPAKIYPSLTFPRLEPFHAIICA